MQLANLQAEFIELLTQTVSHSAELHPNEHIVIYRNNITTTLINTLKACYPLLIRLVGDDFFTVAAHAYLIKYPSRSGDLNNYGEYFADFLGSYPPVKSLSYLSEVATFEWISHTLLSAPNSRPFDIERLKLLNTAQYDQLHFTLQSSCRILKFHYPILRIIELCEKETIEVELNQGGDYLLIRREQEQIKLNSLNLAEYTFLMSVVKNEPLSICLKNALREDANFSLEHKLPIWVKQDIFADFLIP